MDEKHEMNFPKPLHASVRWFVFKILTPTQMFGAIVQMNVLQDQDLNCKGMLC